MSCLAAVNTELGRIELHHEDGRFTTRRVVPDARPERSGRTSVCTIPIDREGAREWHELAERRGAVYDALPEEASP
jgi:hypothetical protein